MDVIYVRLNDSVKYEDISYLEAALPPERREKTARYRFEKDKLRSLVAGLLIQRYTGGAGLSYGEHDKPYVSAGSVYFSISHSGDIVAIAVDRTEVGCDVEAVPSDDRLKIADRFYHENERAYVDSAVDKNTAFCRIWTRKEAYLKMTGEGISSDLTAFDTVSLPLSDQLFTVDADGYCLSVCSAGTINKEDVYISELELKSLLEQ